MRLGRGLAQLRRSELGGLAGDSTYTAVWLGAVAAADLAQVALVAHLLGVDDLGRLALVTSTVILVGQFIDVRIGTAETTFGAPLVTSRRWHAAASLFRFGYLIDAATGVLGFIVVALLAPFVGPSLVGGDGTLLMVLFGLTLLVSTVDESSVTLLRLLGRFRLLAAYMACLELTRVFAIGLALVIDRSLTAVLVALVVYDLAGAITNWLAADTAFRRASGQSLLETSADRFAERRSMLGMVIHTNVVSYARIAQVQLPTLLLGALTSAPEVGLYKVGTAAGAIVGRLVMPLYTAVLPRLSRLWAERRREEILRLLRHGTPAAALVSGLALAALIVFRDPVLRLVGGEGALPAGPVLALSGLGYAVSGALFWYPGLLYALGRPGAVSVVAVGTMIVQVLLLVPLAAEWGATGAAAALCVSMLLTNVVGAGLGLRALRAAPAAGVRVDVPGQPGVSGG